MRTFFDVLLWTVGGIVISGLILFTLWELGWLT